MSKKFIIILLIFLISASSVVLAGTCPAPGCPGYLMGAYCSGDQYYAQVRECYLTAESYYQHRVFFTEDQCDYCWEVFIVGNHLHQEVHTQGCPLNGPVDKCPY